MRKLLDIAVNDLRVFLSSRANLVGLLAIPVGMTALLGIFIPSGQGPTRVRLDVIDRDRGAISSQLLEAIRQANDRLVLCPMDNDVDDICDLGRDPSLSLERSTLRVQEGEVSALIEIPSGFTAKVRNFQPVQIRYLSQEDLVTPGLIRQAVDAALLRVNGAIVASQVGSRVLGSLQLDAHPEQELALYQRAAAIWEQDPVQISFQLSAQEAVDPTTLLDVGGFGQSVPGMGSMFVLFTVLGGMTALIGEKKQWTLQRLAATPVSRAQLLGGKVLGRFILGALQYAVVFAVGIIAGINFGRDLLALALIMLTFTLASTSLSFAIGNFLKSEQQAAGVSNLLGFTLAPLGGAWWPLEIVPAFMRTVGHISPIAWAMDGYTSLMFRNGDLSTVWVSIVVLVGMSILFFAFGIWRFRYE